MLPLGIASHIIPEAASPDAQLCPPSGRKNRPPQLAQASGKAPFAPTTTSELFTQGDHRQRTRRPSWHDQSTVMLPSPNIPRTYRIGSS